MERFNSVIGWEQLCLRCLKNGDREKMRIDIQNSFYVCVNCGWAVESGCTCIYDKFGENSGRSVKWYSYSRKKQFRDRMERKRCLPERTQILLTSRFVEMNRYYTLELLANPEHGVRRKNILKYEYLIKKMLQILGRNDWAHHFNGPKTKRKLEEYERIWKLICVHFDWPFFDCLTTARLHRELRANTPPCRSMSSEGA